MKHHLAIMARPIIEAILTGKKIIESRFSQRKIPPFNQVFVGDIVYMKPPGKEIIGQFRVKKVICYQGLDPADLNKIFKDYGPKIGPWEVKEKTAYASLIFIGDSERFITSPIKISKKDQRGWVVLD